MTVDDFRAIIAKVREFIVQETGQHAETCTCQDCYYDAMGRELDVHPISAFRISRGGCAGD